MTLDLLLTGYNWLIIEQKTRNRWGREDTKSAFSLCLYNECKIIITQRATGMIIDNMVEILGVTWLSWRLKSSATHLLFQKLVQAISKRNIEVPHHWPFVGGPTGDDGFTPQGPVMRKAFSSHDVIMGSVTPIRCAQVQLTWYMGDFRAGGPLSKQFNTKMATMWRALHN